MIATVRGEVLVRRSDYVVIEAAGVGYRLAVSSETLRSVPAVGHETFLHAETISRDDSLLLYGFSSEEERDLFNMLIGVSGIGPKVAIAALSGGPHRELTRAIISGDAKRFQAVPGIGKHLNRIAISTGNTLRRMFSGQQAALVVEHQSIGAARFAIL